mgnify:CR=1 FL=1
MDYFTKEFTLIKSTHYENKDLLDDHISRLTRLQKDIIDDPFELVKVPSFTFTVNDNILRIEQEYIKGLFVGYQGQDILWKDLVERKSEYTFADYHITNFIRTPFKPFDIYCIDLVSYKKSSRTKRLYNWETRRTQRVLSPSGFACKKDIFTVEQVLAAEKILNQ